MACTMTRPELLEWLQRLPVYNDQGVHSRFVFNTSWAARISAEEAKDYGITLDPARDQAWLEHLEEGLRNGVNLVAEITETFAEGVQADLKNWITPLGDEPREILQRHGCRETELGAWAQRLGIQPDFVVTGRMGKRLLLCGIDQAIEGESDGNHSLEQIWGDEQNYHRFSTNDLRALHDLLMAVEDWIGKGHIRDILSARLCEERAWWEGLESFLKTPEGQALEAQKKQAEQALQKAQMAFAGKALEQNTRKAS